MIDLLDRRPLLVAIAGPNGAGKSTFYRAHLRPAGLRFVNADELSEFLNVGAYQGAEVAAAIRRGLLERRESFVFETVFSDPVQEKLAFLKEAELRGYTVVMFFIGLAGAEISDERVAMRVAEGGHDVPREKIMSRYSRVMDNLRLALKSLDNIRVYDNSDLLDPYRLAAKRENGGKVHLFKPVPSWLKPLLPTG